MDFVCCNSCKEQKAATFFAPYELRDSERKKNNQIYIRKARLQCRSCRNHHRMKERYKITFEQREEMQKNQEGRCLICKTVSKLCVDHCHKSLKVRGLLCNSCNLGLGYFKDNCSFLQEAIHYLKK
jgi:hypothetical protein